jgi:hypothetical protein
MFATVTIQMQDELNEKVIERTIDASNLLVNNDNAPLGFEHSIIGNVQQQKASLNNWILERGNQQHDTILTLISWVINK